MRAIIIGAGEVGGHLVEALQGEEIDLITVDNDPEVIERLRIQYPKVRTVLGDVTDPQLRAELDLPNADLFLAVTDRDETNIVSCLLAGRNMRGKRIARLKGIDWGEKTHDEQASYLGIDLITNPSEVVTDHLVDLIEHPHVSDFISLLDDLMALVRIRIREESPLAGRAVNALKTYAPESNAIAALVLRRGSYVIPHGGFVVTPGDHLYVVLRRDQLKKLGKRLKLPAHGARRVFINGGGHIGYALARRLNELGTRKLWIFEIDAARCRFLSERLENVLVMHASGVDPLALRAESIERADLFISLTQSDDINVVSCMQASTLGAKQTIALVKQPDGIPLLLDQPRLDSAFSPRQLTARRILRFVRGDAMRSVMIFPGSQIEMLEYRVSAGSPADGVPIRALGLPPRVLVAACRRGQSAFIPYGDDVLRGDDTVLMLQDRGVRKVTERCFSSSESVSS